MTGRGRRIVIGAIAAGLAATAAAAFAEREEIAVRWHLYRLRTDPASLPSRRSSEG